LPNIQVPDKYLPRTHLYGEIADCPDYTALENTLLNSVAKNIGAETGAILHFRRDPKGYEIGHNLAHGIGNKIHHQYVSKFHRSDPIILNRQPMPTSHQRTDALTDVYRLSDVCEQSKFVKTDYYNDFLKPSGIRHVLALAIKPKTINNDLMVVIGFHRPPGMRDFGEKALHTAISIAPIVGSTIARLTFKKQLSRYRLLAEDLKFVLQNTGYMVLDDALQIREISPCVSNRTYGDLPFLMQRISLAIQTLNRNRRTQINISCTRRDNERTALNENISLDIERVDSINGVSRFVVRLGFVHTNIAISKCAGKFSWTLREREIVIALAQGLTNAQISDSLIISVRTVENHLRSVYSKADVTSRTQLLRQLLTYTPAHYI